MRSVSSVGRVLCVGVPKNWEAPMFGSMGGFPWSITGCDWVTLDELRVVSGGAVYL